MASSLATMATRYAAHGWPVFPLEPRGKRPLHAGAGGFHEATTDAKQVAAWWEAAPTANIGFVPGRAGLLVVDIDGPDGAKAAEDLAARIYLTLEVSTGKGSHRYFRAPSDLRGRIGNAVLAPQLDLRGDAGYVLLPPSIHPSGARYEWRDAPIADAPAALVAELRRRFADPPPRRVAGSPWRGVAPDNDRRVLAYLAKVPTGLADGRKRTAFVLAAALLHDLERDPSAAFAILSAWNARNVRPLPTHYLERVLVNAAKHGGRRRRAA